MTSSSTEQSSIDESDVQAPEGADVETLETGYRYAWQNVSLPLEEQIEIPPGTTIVNASADLASGGRAWVNVTDATTGLPRCAPTQANGFMDPVEGTIQCAGLTAIDELPATWTLSVEANASMAETIQFDLLSRPLDGIAGDLSLDRLSMPTQDTLPLENVTISGSDSVSLHAEVTRPDVDEPVPVILVSHLAGQVSGPVAEQASGLGQPLDPRSFAQEMAARGYAVVVSDVRGTGQSAGCLDVHGQIEQEDQAAIVSWIEEQEWASGQIGAYGIGYAGSTALEAAIHAPNRIDAVVAFSAVTDIYRDWHFGGVPNGEGQLDPLTGQAIGALGSTGAADPATRLMRSSEGGCSGDAFTGGTDPRAVYDAFYEARNLTTRTQEIQAPVLHAQGLFDRVTKPSMANGLVEELAGNAPGQSLSLVGAWGHGLPTRADVQTLTLAWFDQHLKDRDLGLDAAVDASAAASVTTPTGLAREAPSWPPSPPSPTTLYPAFDAGQLGSSPTQGQASFLLDPVGASGKAEQDDGQTVIRLAKTLQEPTYVSGRPEVSLAATLTGLGNAYVAANLYEVPADGEKQLVSFGMANLAHHAGHDQFSPIQPDQLVRMVLPMQPTERLLEADSQIVLEIRSAAIDDWSAVTGGNPGQLTLEGGAEGTLMALPTAPPSSLAPAPDSVVPRASNASVA